jgi:hypothetical protein
MGTMNQNQNNNEDSREEGTSNREMDGRRKTNGFGKLDDQNPDRKACIPS